MKWLRRKGARGLFRRAKRSGLRRQGVTRPPVRNAEDGPRARAWRRRFRRILRLDDGNRRVDSRATRSNAGPFRLRTFAHRIAGALGRGVACVALAGLAAALPFGSLLGYRYLCSSPHFLVRQVTVAGNESLPSDVIVAAAGLDGPVSTLTMDEDEVAAAVTALDGVRTARVTVELPQNVRIDVSERHPAALVALRRPFLVDEHGAVYQPLERGDTLALPMLTGLRRTDFTDPGRQADARRRIRLALGVIRAWNELGLSAVAPLSEIECDPVYGLIARTAESGTEVWLGDGGDARPKLERLADVLLDLKLRGRVARTVYLDDPNAQTRVVVRSEEVRAAGGLDHVARSESAER